MPAFVSAVNRRAVLQPRKGEIWAPLRTWSWPARRDRTAQLPLRPAAVFLNPPNSARRNPLFTLAQTAIATVAICGRTKQPEPRR